VIIYRDENGVYAVEKESGDYATGGGRAKREEEKLRVEKSVRGKRVF
jgi:hypothetical protein